MGNCLVSIHVTGAHHNGKSYDIDQMAAQFIDLLKRSGHSVTAATVTWGGEGDLLNTAARYPLAGEGR
jgi:hypothetical protein